MSFSRFVLLRLAPSHHLRARGVFFFFFFFPAPAVHVGIDCCTVDEPPEEREEEAASWF